MDANMRAILTKWGFRPITPDGRILLETNPPQKQKSNKDTTTSGTDSEEVPARELTTSYPIFWFLLPEGLKRDALKLKQEPPRE
jgi:hypothetical protein